MTDRKIGQQASMTSPRTSIATTAASVITKTTKSKEAKTKLKRQIVD